MPAPLHPFSSLSSGLPSFLPSLPCFLVWFCHSPPCSPPLWGLFQLLGPVCSVRAFHGLEVRACEMGCPLYADAPRTRGLNRTPSMPELRLLHPHQPWICVCWGSPSVVRNRTGLHHSVTACLGLNKSHFKCHWLSLSFSLAPQSTKLFFSPFLSLLVTFPGNKLQGAIMLCAKESIKPATISLKDVA